MIKRLLIANRGEIAVRIARTAKNMGIESVAVFSDTDKDSFHARFCDKKIYIGKSDSNKSYLNIQNIITAAKQTKSDAIHPGYGFLSENATFSEQCERENILFIGPNSKTIKTMAVKTIARKRIEKLGIPVLSGFDSKNLSFEEVFAKSCSIGFPIMIKAAYGGGGRGMRAVYEEENLKENLLSAARESKSSFGKDELLIEKLITKPRHIEVQIIADSHGNIFHLYERDCSLQRNNQKVVEECPATNMSKKLKSQMYEAAITIAKDINYLGVGTVEFILEDNNFYFMEMNTRLQVEHAITEKITGLDLVQLQLQVSTGEMLNLNQDNILSNGHAIECRLYAEDPEENYKPCPGLVKKFEFKEDIGIRIDKGVETGDEVSSYYDPMIAKFISHAKTRKESLKKMSKALEQVRIYGITTNKYFLSNIVSHQKIIDGKYDTNFLKLNLKKLAYNKKDYSNNFKIRVATIWIQNRNILSKSKKDIEVLNPWSNLTRFRVNLSSIEKLSFLEGKNKFVILLRHEKTKIVLIDEKNKPHNLLENIKIGEVIGDIIYLQEGNYTREIQFLDPFEKNYESSLEKLGLIAPMPGKIVKIFYKIGEEVKENSLVVMMEAMKMEHRIISNAKGKIKKINCKEGDLIKEGTLLIELSA